MTCDVCDQPLHGETHHPHTPGCPNTGNTSHVTDCDCNHTCHPHCCPTCTREATA